MDEQNVTVISQSQLKSPVFWGSVIVGIAGILAMFGVISQDLVTKISGAVATLLALIVGNVNNSTNPVGIGANLAVKK